LAAFSDGTTTSNVSLTVGNGSGTLPATAAQAIQNAQIINSKTFATADYKSGVRLLEAGIKYNF